MVKKVKKILKYIFSMPITLYINYRAFPIKTALHLPIICSYNVRVGEIHRNSLVLEGKPKFGMIKLGMSNGSYGNGCNGKSILNIFEGGRMIFQNTACLSNNFTINIGRQGVLKIGNNFWSNYGLLISCSNKIMFGDDTLLGWNCTFLDSDGHKMFPLADKNGYDSNSATVNIGNHVWFTSNTITLKGGGVGDNCVVAQGCVLTKKFNISNVCIGGVPARVIKESIMWEK